MLTYDDAKEVRALATAHGFFIKPIAMKTTHHKRMYELAITNHPFAGTAANESLRLLEQSPRYRAKRKSRSAHDGKIARESGKFISSGHQTLRNAFIVTPVRPLLV